MTLTKEQATAIARLLLSLPPKAPDQTKSGLADRESAKPPKVSAGKQKGKVHSW